MLTDDAPPAARLGPDAAVTSSCHRHQVDAFAYLRDVLQRLAHDPQPSAEVLRVWLPDRWKPPVEATDDS
jgi:hypothetical protein